jgi:hypothetical protein
MYNHHLMGVNTNIKDSPWVYVSVQAFFKRTCWNYLLAGLESIRVYIDDILHVTKASWEDHLKLLDKIWFCIRRAGLKIIANKSFFSVPKLEYLGYIITRESISQTPMTTRIPQANAIIE